MSEAWRQRVGRQTGDHHKRFVVFTDPDGTLLDRASHSHCPRCVAAEQVGEQGIPVVLCSSRTRAELEMIQLELHLRDPFINENGGGAYLPRGYFSSSSAESSGYDVLSFAGPHQHVVETLHRTAAAVGIEVRSFNDMSVQEVADAYGLSLSDARLAQLREYDEPFRLLEPTPAAQSRLFSALRRAGLRCVNGGKFHHATAGTDMGKALRALKALYKLHVEDVVMVGVSDGHGDASLLREVDIPIVVLNHDVDTVRVLQKVPTARVTSTTGLRGWEEAIGLLMDGNSHRRLQR